MADFNTTQTRRDALLIKRLGELVDWQPVTGPRVTGIRSVIDKGVNLSGDFGDVLANETLAQVLRADVGKAVEGDALQAVAKTWLVRRVVQDDGFVVTVLVA